MGVSIQAIIFSVALPTLAACAQLELDYGNAKIGQKLDFNSETARQSISSTGAPNFIRLVIMRLIYGIASTMGVEDRLEDTFNGAFVPPNSDGLGLPDFGGADDGDGLFGDIFEADY